MSFVGPENVPQRQIYPECMLHIRLIKYIKHIQSIQINNIINIIKNKPLLHFLESQIIKDSPWTITEESEKRNICKIYFKNKQ